MNSKCGVQSKRKCRSHESCICIVGFPACGWITCDICDAAGMIDMGKERSTEEHSLNGPREQ